MAPVWSDSEVTYRQGYTVKYTGRAACVCSNCRNITTVVERETESNWSGMSPQGVREELDGADELVWSPLAATAPDYPRVPPHVARCAQEAHMSHSIGAEAASILMARTTIEATAKSKNITKGTLFAKIEELSKEGVIRTSALALAHAIRHLGNDMAHGDVEDAPTTEDASDALQLMDLILSEVFQATSLAEEILARRSKG
jgi:hypothetical protein